MIKLERFDEAVNVARTLAQQHRTQQVSRHRLVNALGRGCVALAPVCITHEMLTFAACRSIKCSRRPRGH